jgi:hypothetical protein
MGELQRWVEHVRNPRAVSDLSEGGGAPGLKRPCCGDRKGPPRTSPARQRAPRAALRAPSHSSHGRPGRPAGAPRGEGKGGGRGRWAELQHPCSPMFHVGNNVLVAGDEVVDVHKAQGERVSERMGPGVEPPRRRPACPSRRPARAPWPAPPSGRAEGEARAKNMVRPEQRTW